MRERGATYSEARKAISSRRARQILNDRGIVNELNRDSIVAEVHQTQGSYYETNDQTMGRSYAEAAAKQSQRQENTIGHDTIKKHIDSAISTMTSKLLSFLQEVLALNMQKQNRRGRKLLLLGLAKHHFGMNIDENIFGGDLEFEYDYMVQEELPNNKEKRTEGIESQVNINEEDIQLRSQPIQTRNSKKPKNSNHNYKDTNTIPSREREGTTRVLRRSDKRSNGKNK